MTFIIVGHCIQSELNTKSEVTIQTIKNLNGTLVYSLGEVKINRKISDLIF